MSRGLMSEPEGPSVESDLQWDTASAFSINMETPWDILRAQLLWSIWRQRVAHAFDDERFHLGLVLWHAWQNSIYCAIEAYKELHRHKRNEEKRQEQIACFEEIWTTANIFARRQNTEIKWHLTPPSDFLPQALAAWMAPPIRINRLSPSPDLEADFTAQPDFQTRVQEFLDEIANNLHPHTNSHENSDLEPGPQEINQGAEATSQNPTPRPLSPAERPPIELNGSERPSTSRSPTTPGTFETTAQRNPLSSLNVNLQNLPRPSSAVNSSPGLGNHFDSATQNPPPPTKPKSRPNTRCNFGPKTRNLAQTGQGNPLDTEDARELDALLREIDEVWTQVLVEHTHTREHTSAPDSESKKTQNGDPYQVLGSGHHSHRKVKCTFGPHRRRSHDGPHPTSPTRVNDDHPTPPLSPINQDQITAVLPVNSEVDRSDIASSSSPSAEPFRVTLMPPFSRTQSPFCRYFPTAPEAPRPNPNRFALARMGITEEELVRRATQEIDAELRTFQAERRLESLCSPDGLQRVLSKEECLRFFMDTGVPPPGPLWGVWRWAADLGIARYNFVDEIGIDDDYSALNAYD